MPSKSVVACALSYWRFHKRIMQPQMYKQFLILDFEATCERGEQIKPQEIIEFPCVQVNATTLEVVSVFHNYVQPKKPLTSFCTGLTGITQEMVDNSPFFPDVLNKFLEWGEQQHLWDTSGESIFVTCGDWDLRVMMPDQCKQLNYPVPLIMKEWINIRKVFAQVMGVFPKTGLPDMMRILKLPRQGRLHSGIDDCMNIHIILRELVKRNCVLQPTSHLDY